MRLITSITSFFLLPGLIEVPEYPFNEQRETFSFVSLLTRPEVIMALCQVRDECNKTAAMSLFHSTLTKYGRLEAFEQIQTQTFSQVTCYGRFFAGMRYTNIKDYNHCVLSERTPCNTVVKYYFRPDKTSAYCSSKHGTPSFT